MLGNFKQLLPEFVECQPVKGGPTCWLPRDSALQIERIRAHLNDRHWLMVDHDNSPTVQAHTLYDIEPNIVVYNQTNPHRHQAFWLLNDPVYCQQEVRERQPYRYLTAIEAAYDERYGADLCFARHIHRNPCAFINDTDWRHWRTHTLAELAAPVNLSARRAKALDHSINASEGRNNVLFDEVRRWAYPQVEIARSASYEVWHRQVVTRALAMSEQIVSDRGALPAREVGYVAKSVAGFVYYRYTGAGCILTPELRAIKAELGRKGGLIGGKVSKGGGRPKSTNWELWEAIQKMKAEGHPHSSIAQDLKISASTVSKYAKISK